MEETQAIQSQEPATTMSDQLQTNPLLNKLLQTLVDEISNQVIKRIEHLVNNEHCDSSSFLYSLRSFCEERCDLALDDLSSKIKDEIESYCDSDFNISNYESEISEICIDAIKNNITFSVEVD